MSAIQSSLDTAAIAVCLFSAGILEDRRRWDFSWFSIFLGVVTFGFLFELLMVHPAVPLKNLWLGLRMATCLLLAPAAWLVVRETLEGKRPLWGTVVRPHGWVILAGTVCLLPLMSNAHWGHDYSWPGGLSRGLNRVAHEGMLICVFLFAVQVPYYLWRCWRSLMASPGRSKWLQLPLWVLLTTWVLGLLRTMQCVGHAPEALGVVFTLLEVAITVGSVFSIVRRRPVRSRTDGDAGEVDVAPMVAAAVQQVPEEAKYLRSGLDAAASARIQQKITAALARADVYGDSLLNLRSLSQTLGEKPHYVSQVINRDLGSTFYELVNRRRIEQAKHLLVTSPERTVLEIGLEVGFNSKSTFNTAFRRETGVTPTEFRTQAKPG